MLELRYPFRLATGVDDAVRRTVLLQIGDGIGEATPVYYRGETPQMICDALTVISIPDDFAPTPESIDAILDRCDLHFPFVRSAKAAVDIALHDLWGQHTGQPLYELLGTDPDQAPHTSYTIGLAEPDVIRAKVEAAQPYSILKIKLGSPADWDTLKLVRSLTDKPLRVDANQGWTPQQAIEMVRQLADFGVELVEQPVPSTDLDGLAAVTQASPIPVIADESCQTFEDIARLQGKVHGINIKLMKCGGLRAARRMIEAARGYGMQVMLGCMIETSVGITAAAHLSPLVDYADLDGNLLISNDPFRGVTVREGRLHLPTTPGLGIRQRDQ